MYNQHEGFADNHLALGRHAAPPPGEVLRHPTEHRVHHSRPRAKGKGDCLSTREKGQVQRRWPSVSVLSFPGKQCFGEERTFSKKKTGRALALHLMDFGKLSDFTWDSGFSV